MRPLVLVDIGSTYTKASMIDEDTAAIVEQSSSPTTVDDISQGVFGALEPLRRTVSEQDWQQAAKLACSSAAGGLKMIAVGLVPDLTAKAAQQAALGAGARVLSCYSYELTDGDVEEIHGHRPDMILLAGGTDGGNQSILLNNAAALAAAPLHIPVVVAGNRSAAGKVRKILTAGWDVTVVDNVMPSIGTLNVESARDRIRSIFMDTIVYAKGFRKVEDWLDGLLMPTPAAVLEAGKIYSRSAGETIIVDLGGATTDVHSFASGKPSSAGVVFRGLPEPAAKRTVEGDLGLRVSAAALAAAVSEEALAEAAGVDLAELHRYLKAIADNPDLLAASDAERRIDCAMARSACSLALRRHAGRIEEMFTPSGRVWLQEGKDLSLVRRVVFTGGYFARGTSTAACLQRIFAEPSDMILLPKQPELYHDRSYILAAAGLAAERSPQLAWNMMKNELRSMNE